MWNCEYLHTAIQITPESTFFRSTSSDQVLKTSHSSNANIISINSVPLRSSNWMVPPGHQLQPFNKKEKGLLRHYLRQHMGSSAAVSFNHKLCPASSELQRRCKAAVTILTNLCDLYCWSRLLAVCQAPLQWYDCHKALYKLLIFTRFQT